MECWQGGWLGGGLWKEQRLALADGWRRVEAERCGNWQQIDRWKVRGGVRERCSGSMKGVYGGVGWWWWLSCMSQALPAPMITCGFESASLSHKEASEMASTWQADDCSITSRDLGPPFFKKEMSLNYIPPSLLWHSTGNQDFYMHKLDISFWKWSRWWTRPETYLLLKETLI